MDQKKFTATVTYNLFRKVQPVDGYFVFIHYDDEELTNDEIIDLAKEETKGHPHLKISDIKNISVTDIKENTKSK